MSLKDFEIQNKLGEGAFSTVFKAMRKSDSNFYALKQVKLGNLSKKEKENALNEIRILASFDHPNIIGFKEAFLDDNMSVLCIVMDYAEKGDLYNLITKCKSRSAKIPESQIWSILIQSLEALKCLHSNNILHRDIKSANIFLTASDTVKLGDLNVSKVMKQGLAYTQTGTPYYASPEVWKDQPYHSASDIWSLGCVIYELASLNPPFTGRDMNSLCKNVIRGNFVDITGISKELMATIRTMLQVNPGARPSASKLLENAEVGRRNSSSPIKKNYDLLKTIFFDNRVISLRNRLPKSQYCRQVSECDIKENLPSIDEDLGPKVSKSYVKEQLMLPRVPLTKALPPKVRRPLAEKNSAVNSSGNQSPNPASSKANVASPTIITHGMAQNGQIKRVGSLILEQKRYYSPQNPVYERVASLGNLEKPCTPKPLWWG